MGTPQMRWREMHQSGRVATMLVMRSCPQAGSHVTVLIWSMARWRKVVLVPSGGASSRVSMADEPLLGGAGDDGVVAAPAVGVGVLEVGGGEERASFFEQLDDDGVGFEDGEAFVGLGLASAEALGVRSGGRRRLHTGLRAGRNACRWRSRRRRGRGRCGRRRCPGRR